MNREKTGCMVATPHTPTNQNIAVAKVHIFKDLSKVLEYFHYKSGSSLDCSLATGIMRCSICWYIAYLQSANMLTMIGMHKDVTTGRMVKYYSANPTRKENPHE